jgi:hypothetical protein
MTKNTMTKNLFLYTSLILPSFAGIFGQPVVSPATKRSSNELVTREMIDDILITPKGGLLNNPQRSLLGKGQNTFISGGGVNSASPRNNRDFIVPVTKVTIPGIPSTGPWPPRFLKRWGTVNPPTFEQYLSYKSQHHLFDPTRSHLLRDLSPDRPDATESPITVDAGRFVLEASLFDYRRDGGVESFTYGALNLKAGLTHDLDFQTIVDLRSGSQGDWDTFGNLTFRLKWNLYGNDEGDTALALMPFVTAPTRDGEWEGGIIIPWATSLTDTIGLGLMAEFDYLHDGDDYHFEFLHTAVLGFALTEKLGAYAEYIGIIKEDHYESYLAGGMNYAINENLILDFGVQGGLNNYSEDFGFFTGFTKRF